MSAVTTPATDVDLLRAIRDLADPAAHDAGSDARLPALLERLLDCEAVVIVTDEQRPALLRVPVADAGGQTELVIEGAVDGVVRGEVRVRRPPARPFSEREVLLCDLLQPHVSAWLTHRGDSRDLSGRDLSGRAALTQRQVEILTLVRCGLSNKEVAHALGLTHATVRKHLENAFVRLGVTSRTAAVAEAFRGCGDVEADHV